ncbi:hypothetical protein HJB77_27885 [Rhizobium lentis]|uniref:DUF3800 domain-containing protein n=1 Tax=Rhizobium lentis TaxID=1138194 RepID=UPI001C82B582|nr:DUF3800 domain-containing protein [Rhizobium lentis]MBX5180038.1 hypothetical protein [Rhizobium lentis]
MARIYFDESGQTGAHLPDRNQPYPTLESTDFPEAELAEGRGIQPNKHYIVFGDWYLGRVKP